jgi:predicted DNA-binding WGR domain protein
MNFGPINQRGGEKRLNVIFSRARHHMAIVSSIRHHDITNDYNDGANSLKNFLQYAEAISKADAVQARRVLENLNPLSRKALAPLSKGDAVVEQLAAALRKRGHAVDLNVGQSRFRCDLAVRAATDHSYQLGILVDTDGHYANPNLLDRYLMQPSILRAFGWRFALVLTKDWYHNPDDVVARLEKLLEGKEATEEPVAAEEEPAEAPAAPVTVVQTEAPAQTAPADIPNSGLPSGEGRGDQAKLKEAPVTNGPDESKDVSAPAIAPEPQPEIASPPSSRRASSRYLEFIGGSSRKFWEISVQGNSFTVRFGRIGTPGQSQIKAFADETKANHEAESLINEKLKKGYEEKLGN